MWEELVVLLFVAIIGIILTIKRVPWLGLVFGFIEFVFGIFSVQFQDLPFMLSEIPLLSFMVIVLGLFCMFANVLEWRAR